MNIFILYQMVFHINNFNVGNYLFIDNYLVFLLHKQIKINYIQLTKNTIVQTIVISTFRKQYSTTNLEHPTPAFQVLLFALRKCVFMVRLEEKKPLYTITHGNGTEVVVKSHAERWFEMVSR